jgi:hypothetical protein
MDVYGLSKVDAITDPRDGFILDLTSSAFTAVRWSRSHSRRAKKRTRHTKRCNRLSLRRRSSRLMRWRDEARRIAANIDKLPELLMRPQKGSPQ